MGVSQGAAGAEGAWVLVLFADGLFALRLASSVLHSTWEPGVEMFLISAVSTPARCRDAVQRA